MAYQYYYEKYSIDYYWDQISSGAIDSTTLHSNTVSTTPRSETDVQFDFYYTTDSPTPQKTSYGTVVKETVNGFNNYKFGDYVEEQISINDIFYIQESAYKLIKAQYKYYTGTTWRYRYCDYIEEINLDTYTIYKHQRKGSYITTVVADDGTYPDNGISGGYWWVKTTKPQVSLGSIGNKSVNEGQTLSFQIPASIDGTSTITFSANGLPTGATFNNSTGQFSWNTDYHDEGTYDVTFTAAANGTTDSETITITVNHVDIEPILDPIGNKTVIEYDNLDFAVTVTNPDNVSITLSATGLPSGASFNSNTGEFSWIPGYTQAGEYQVTFNLTYAGGSDSETIIITVNDVITILDHIGDKSVDENKTLSFQVTASTSDGKGTITYGATPLPTGASFDTASGEFSWQPTYNQSGSYNVTFEASANQSTDSETITITVNEVHKAPTNRIPEQNYETNERRHYFEFVLPANDETDTNKYHGKLRVSTTTDMNNLLVNLDSKDNQSQWELWDTVNSQWIPFPSTGVDPDSKVRVKPDYALQYGLLYWDCASWESTYGYGEYSSYWKINVLISTDAPYVLDIAGTSYKAYSLYASETSNGEIGSISFSANNSGGTAFHNIDYGNIVILAINDGLGNQEQFKGIIRSKIPAGADLQVSAITGDGILAERRVKENYNAQDIGLTAKAIIDTYCSPLTSTNINTATGIVVPVQANDKTPLKVFEELRRQHGIYYFVDANWDVNLYTPSEMSNSVVTVRHGD